MGDIETFWTCWASGICIPFGMFTYGIYVHNNTHADGAGFIMGGAIGTIIVMVLMLVGLDVRETTIVQFPSEEIKRKDGHAIIYFTSNNIVYELDTTHPEIYNMDDRSICTNRTEVVNAFGIVHKREYGAVECSDSNKEMVKK